MRYYWSLFNTSDMRLILNNRIPSITGLKVHLPRLNHCSRSGPFGIYAFLDVMPSFTWCVMREKIWEAFWTLHKTSTGSFVSARICAFFSRKSFHIFFLEFCCGNSSTVSKKKWNQGKLSSSLLKFLRKCSFLHNFLDLCWSFNQTARSLKKLNSL